VTESPGHRITEIRSTRDAGPEAGTSSGRLSAASYKLARVPNTPTISVIAALVASETASASQRQQMHVQIDSGPAKEQPLPYQQSLPKEARP
jgi:hypothetical protein